MICTVCGILKNNDIDFYENMYKIIKKSVYIGKYHIRNVLTDIALKNILAISRDIINNVCKTFDLISTVLHIVNKDRKRIISITFIIHKLFEKWNLNLNVPITKSKKTLNDYEKYLESALFVD